MRVRLRVAVFPPRDREAFLAHWAQGVASRALALFVRRLTKWS